MTFKINGTTVKEPKIGGIGVTDEPIWSSNTGRSTTGKMIGDIIAWKTTVEVAWPPLTYAEMKKIRDAIKAGGKFFEIEYPDIESGSSLSGMQTTKTVYVANVPRMLYSTSNKYKRYADVTIEFIER